MTALEIAVKALEEIHRGAFSPTGVATLALADIAEQQVDVTNSGAKIDTSAERVDSVNVTQDDALALAIIEHLGPAALTGGKMTLLEAFERGYGAGLAASPNERLLEIIASCYAGLGATFDLPERFLDVLADPLNATQEQIDALLPVKDSENAAIVAQASQVEMEVHEEDLIDIVRTLVCIADRMSQPSSENYPSPLANGSPLLAAARRACVERGFTEDGLSIDAAIAKSGREAG